MATSGYAAFDKALKGQGGLIMTGNVISDTMVGFHVRPRNETACNGFFFEKGLLHNKDRDTLGRAYFALDSLIQRRLKESHFDDKSGWVYVIRHYESKTPRIHGALVVDYQNNVLPAGYIDYTGPGSSRKSPLALKLAASVLLKK